MTELARMSDVFTAGDLAAYPSVYSSDAIKQSPDMISFRSFAQSPLPTIRIGADRMARPDSVPKPSYISRVVEKMNQVRHSVEKQSVDEFSNVAAHSPAHSTLSDFDSSKQRQRSTPISIPIASLERQAKSGYRTRSSSKHTQNSGEIETGSFKDAPCDIKVDQTKTMEQFVENTVKNKTIRVTPTPHNTPT